MPSDCWSKISSIVLGDSSLTASTSPALETIDWIRATDRALPCPFAAEISARRQASVAASATSSNGGPAIPGLASYGLNEEEIAVRDRRERAAKIPSS